MATPPSTEAMKARIITHMNADHSNSNRLFTRYYSKLPLGHAKTATLEEITLNHLILSSSFGRNLILFDPPLKSFPEARERLVSMHETCLKELNVDGVMLDQYVPPNRWWQIVLFTACFTCFTTLPFRPLIKPETHSFISQIYSVGGYVPWLAEFTYIVAPLALTIMLCIHSWEAVFMARTRMKRYEVEMFSWLWWAWVGDAFVEGFGAFLRVDETVEGMKEKKVKPQGLARPKA